MNIIKLYDDFHLDYKTFGHKHCRPGYVNVECPLCTGAHEGYHLSYHLTKNFFMCWRCGRHSVKKVIAALLQIPESQVYYLLQSYGGIPVAEVVEKPTTNTLDFILPSHLEPLSKKHKLYLENRNFDPEYLERYWKLQGTGPVSTLKHTDEITIDYRFRIFIPFFWDKQMVSFDTRDITGKAQNKYMACPIERELMQHKRIIYGRQDKWKETGIAVEGPTDVWRFGANSFATSGIKFTTAQLRTIAKTFTRVPVCYDGGEDQARQQADKLVSELRFRGVDSFRVDIIGDPGDMDQNEANYLVKQLIK
jgi:hypothetical protein